MNDVGEALLQLRRIGIDRGPRSRSLSIATSRFATGYWRERFHTGGKRRWVQPLARDRESVVGGLGQIEHLLDLNQKVGRCHRCDRVFDIALPPSVP